ncbi:protein O-mannosyl-transferase TMTC4-like isoform X3 [Apostichopus japonicus]|uniref:protein O-mannosyl-transferase TMTC4-like isoform X3 n=1 Tax=Stichopus japonicus TaxID=307972 RepID=UPI003AB469FE
MKYDQKSKLHSPVRKGADYVKKSQTGEYFPKLLLLQDWDHALPIPKLQSHISSIIVAFLAIACYGNSIYGGFVFDDSEAIENNKDVTQERTIASLFHHDFWGDEISKQESHKSYRPLAILTFRLNYYLAGGLNPVLFHLPNVVLHAVVCVLSLRVFGALMGHGQYDLNQNIIIKCPKASMLCAILFTVHPIHSESVAALVGRADLLCAVFFFVSFLFYVSACKNGSVGTPMLLCVIFCSVSMLCKEQGITVLGVCSVYDLLYVGGFSLHIIGKSLLSSSPLHLLKAPWSPLLIRHAILFSTGFMLLAFRYTIMGASAPQFTPVDNPASFANHASTRFINYNYLFAINGWLLLNPISLCFDWSMGCIPLIQSWTDPRLAVVALFWLLLFLLLFQCAINESHQTRTLSMGFAVLVITFLPASNLFFRVGFVIAERNLYLPSVGYIILVVLGTNHCARYCKMQGRKVIQLLLIVLVVSHMGKSIHRSYQWSFDEELYKAGLKVCPQNAKVHYNIAKAAADRGRDKVAIQSYREAIRLHPEYDHAMNNLANLLKEDEQIAEAELLLNRALNINPKFAAAWMNLGIVQASLKKYSQAQHSYEEALSHRRNYPDCYFNLGNLELFDDS